MDFDGGLHGPKSRSQARVAYPLRGWQRVGLLFALLSSLQPSTYGFSDLVPRNIY